MNAVLPIAHRLATLGLIAFVLGIVLMFAGHTFYNVLPAAFLLMLASFVTSFGASQFAPVDPQESRGLWIFNLAMMFLIAGVMIAARMNHLAPTVKLLRDKMAGA